MDAFTRLKRAAVLLYVVIIGTEGSVEAEQIQTTKSNQCVDDSGNPAHASENQSNQIKVEKSDQSPVDSANDCECQTETIQKSISHKSPSFRNYSIPFYFGNIRKRTVEIW